MSSKAGQYLSARTDLTVERLKRHGRDFGRTAEAGAEHSVKDHPWASLGASFAGGFLASKAALASRDTKLGRSSKTLLRGALRAVRVAVLGKVLRETSDLHETVQQQG